MPRKNSTKQSDRELLVHKYYLARVASADVSDVAQFGAVLDDVDTFDATMCAALGIDAAKNPPHFLNQIIAFA